MPKPLYNVINIFDPNFRSNSARNYLKINFALRLNENDTQHFVWWNFFENVLAEYFKKLIFNKVISVHLMESSADLAMKFIE